MSLVDGRKGNVVIVGPRENPRGVALILPASEAGQKPETVFLAEGAELLSAEQTIDIRCMQERLHGLSGLEPPPELVA